MFDLEQSIGDWRRQMLAAGIKTPVPLEELESHLREEIERQMKSETNPQKAFENSVQRIGHADELKSEFKKTCETGGNRSRKFLWVGVIGLALMPIMNLLGLLVFHRSSSVFFSDEWWSGWFPNYLLWATFSIIGLGGPISWKCPKATRENKTKNV